MIVYVIPLDIYFSQNNLYGMLTLMLLICPQGGSYLLPLKVSFPWVSGTAEVVPFTAYQTKAPLLMPHQLYSQL